MMALAALSAAACVPDYSEHVVRGVLYTDSTKTAVIPNASMTFRESSGSHGTFTSDAEGRWGFSYIRNLDNPVQTSAKFQMTQYDLVVKMGDDTVFYDVLTSGYSTDDTVAAYPGFMECLRNRWYNNSNDTINNDTI